MHSFRSLLAALNASLLLASITALAVPCAAAPHDSATDNWADTLGSNGEGHDVTRDSAGNVIAAGHQVAGVFVNDMHFSVAKWSPDGARLWERRLETALPWRDRALAVRVDAQDNVVAAGFAASAAGQPQLTVAKWNPEGELLWSRPVAEPLSRNTNLPHPAASLALGDDGSAFVAGSAGATFVNASAVVARISPDGQVAWVYRNDTASDQVTEFVKVGLDRRGDVFVVGAPGPMLLVKLGGADGRRRWAAQFGAGFGQMGRAHGLAVDRQGHVVLCGSAVDPKGGSSLQFAVSRFHGSTGKRLWERFFGYGSANSVAVNSQGEVAVGGTLAITDFTVMKLSAKRGDPVWTRQFFGRFIPTNTGANSVAFGPGDEIAAGGEIRGFVMASDALVATWSAAGELLWKQRLTSEVLWTRGDVARAVAVGADGRVALAGVFGVGGSPGLAGALLHGWYTQPKDLVWMPDAVYAGTGTAALQATLEAPQSVAEVSGSGLWSYHGRTELPVTIEDGNRIVGSTPVPAYSSFDYSLGFGLPLLITRDTSGVLRAEEGPLVSATPAFSGRLSPSPAGLTYRRTPAGKTRTLILTLRNTGWTQLRLAFHPDLGGPFSWHIAGGPPPVPGANWPSTLSLDAGSSVSVAVTFSPPARGSFAGALQVWSSDPARPSVTIPITGTGQ